MNWQTLIAIPVQNKLQSKLSSRLPSNKGKPINNASTVKETYKLFVSLRLGQG